MNNFTLARLFSGLAAGLALWSLQEVAQLANLQLPIPASLALSFQGLLIGALLGGIFLSLEGYLDRNIPRMAQGLKIGLLFGAIGGMSGFFLGNRLVELVIASDLGLTGLGIFAAQKWLPLLLAIGIAIGVRDQSYLQMTRGVAATLTTHILLTALSGYLYLAPISGFVHLAIESLFLCLVFSTSFYYFSNFRRTEWLRMLNGDLRDQEFELNKEVHFLGTQSLDSINLSSYPNINSTHAKLIKFYSGYSLVDNDPFGRTFVNFRSITEQPLKNGDIIKLGTALFQYCKST